MRLNHHIDQSEYLIQKPGSIYAGFAAIVNLVLIHHHGLSIEFSSESLNLYVI